MFIQNRPFFRKKMINVASSKQVCTYSSKSSYKSNKKSKLTPHKTKSDILASYPNTYISGLRQPHLFLIKRLIFNILGVGKYAVIENYLGIQNLTLFTKGVSLSTYFKFIQVHNHVIGTIFAEVKVVGKVWPVHSVVCGKSKFGTCAQKYAVIRPDGSLELKLLNTLKIAESILHLGSPTRSFEKSAGVVSQVRGVAKNPVDHPNGGRANTKGSFKTP